MQREVAFHLPRTGRVLSSCNYLHLLWQVLFYAFPLGLLIAIAFWVVDNYQLTPAFTLNNYSELLAKPRYRLAVVNSLRLSFLAASMAVAFALPIAQALAVHVMPKLRWYLFTALLLPFFSSYVVRMFGWQIWLNDQGILSGFMRQIGEIKGPMGILFTETAALVGLLSVLIPIASVVIYLSLSRLNHTLIFAAHNLGALRWQTFWYIQLPFALPGMLVSFLFCFLLAFGDFVCASILGGNKVYYLSIAIQDRVKINDWPMAAALGTVLLGISLTIVASLFTVFVRLPATKTGKQVERQP